MKLKEMFAGVTTDPAYKGFITTDNMVLAVDITTDQNADVDDFAIVCAMGGTDRKSSLNPEEKTNSYYYHGKSTMKTGNQRTIDFTEDRYIGDEFQDFALSHKMKYATGQKAIVKYAYFNTLTGEGEKGSGTLTITDDGSGAPEENLSISGSIKKSGANPEEFVYQGFGGYTELKASPADWSTGFANYYERSGGAFVKLTASTAPTFEKGKYYSKKPVEAASNTPQDNASQGGDE